MEEKIPDMIPLGLMWYCAFLISVTLHEAAHAFFALKLGDRTAYHGGQVTLDPIPHIQREPFGMVVIPIMSFILAGWMLGWGSTPYNASWARQYPRRCAGMAFAGPGANLLLVALCAIIIRIGLFTGVLVAPEAIRFTQITVPVTHAWLQGPTVFLSILLSLNLILLFFNLLPFPPLDGSALPLLFMKHRDAQYLMERLHQPAVAWIGIIVAWNLFDVLFGPIHLWSINLLYIGVASYG